jgi:hypothetical protein
MQQVKKRAKVGWIAGVITVVAIFVLATIGQPTVAGATAASVGRGGLLTVVGILPILFAGRAISRFTVDNTTAAVVLPVFLALLLGTLMFVFGWIPENTRVCSGLARYSEIELGPECFTPWSARLTQLAEALGLWVVFGLVLAASFRLRERKALKKAQAV